MHATFRQLRLFLALAEHGSISAAANACHVTQPTASMQLKELADSIGSPLYEVIGKKVFLTHAGKALAQTARNIANEWASYEQLISAQHGLTQGKLKIAIVSTAKYFVPKLLGEFFNQYPDIDLSLEIHNRARVIERLRENLDDLYVMTTPPSDIDVVQEEFLNNPLEIIASARHPLAGQAHIPLSELVNERFILREKGSGTRMYCNAYFETHQFFPEVRLELGSNEAIKQAVSAGLGLSVISHHALGEHYVDESLAVLDVVDFPIASKWYVVHLKGKRLSPIAEVFREYLLSKRH
ncbi:LysR family transcriptional regulator [Leeia sp. TBRC 13508]|uniref:LysR family transcriptional regulator n=1 Tax=Leeia speluncae TaxID=2884804 RepID=A0ABS8D4M3_9NEIS|nr:LysR family transcriptional regulator [Leeia speluncae]MCB6183142.1 LysR family transcriptional regulator [Leeia speluncae]